MLILGNLDLVFFLNNASQNTRETIFAEHVRDARELILMARLKMTAIAQIYKQLGSLIDHFKYIHVY